MHRHRFTEFLTDLEEYAFLREMWTMLLNNINALKVTSREDGEKYNKWTNSYKKRLNHSIQIKVNE